MKPKLTFIKTTLIGLIIIGLMGIAATGFATETKEVEETPIAAASDYTLEYGKEAVIMGVIEKTTTGLFLLDGKGTFLLMGDDELGGLVGQPVEVRGMLKKGEKNNIILVEQAKVID